MHNWWACISAGHTQLLAPLQGWPKGMTHSFSYPSCPFTTEGQALFSALSGEYKDSLLWMPKSLFPCLPYYCIRSVRRGEENESLSPPPTLLSSSSPHPPPPSTVLSQLLLQKQAQPPPAPGCPNTEENLAQELVCFEMFGVEMAVRLKNEHLVIETAFVLPHGEKRTIVILFSMGTLDYAK